MAEGDEEIARDLQEHLHPWGWRLIFHLTCTGLTFKRYQKAEFDRRVGVWNARSRSFSKAGVYDPKHNQVMVVVQHWSPRILYHEMAHALDRLISVREGSFSSGLWHGFAPTRIDFFSTYAASHPSEYFAVCLERFLCSDSDELWLSRNDPGMHAFLTALFELSATGET